MLLCFLGLKKALHQHVRRSDRERLARRIKGAVSELRSKGEGELTGLSRKWNNAYREVSESAEVWIFCGREGERRNYPWGGHTYPPKNRRIRCKVISVKWCTRIRLTQSVRDSSPETRGYSKPDLLLVNCSMIG